MIQNEMTKSILGCLQLIGMYAKFLKYVPTRWKGIIKYGKHDKNVHNPSNLDVVKFSNHLELIQSYIYVCP